MLVLQQRIDARRVGALDRAACDSGEAAAFCARIALRIVFVARGVEARAFKHVAQRRVLIAGFLRRTGNGGRLGSGDTRHGFGCCSASSSSAVGVEGGQYAGRQHGAGPAPAAAPNNSSACDAAALSAGAADSLSP
ncbi:hypothetical protein ADM96_38300 [Burkholderia sp. ST111]|nr:hypothetical protein ADM96_38300 [Burkholderia sp. ST111]